MNQKNPFDVKLINPFVNAVVDTFSKMLSLATTREKLFLDPEGKALKYFTAQIGLSGEEKKGVVIMTYENEFAYKAAEKFLGMPPDDEEEVMDCLGEIVNIVSGSAKREFSEQGMPMKLALPTVTAGAEKVHFGESQPRLAMEFSCELGIFGLQFQIS
ncbi:chemotaxis protein CheX [Candidatus Riflebacteria bacterium]